MDRRKLIILGKENYKVNRKWGLNFVKNNHKNYIFVDKIDIRNIYNIDADFIKEQIVLDLEFHIVKTSLLKGIDVVLMSDNYTIRWEKLKKEYDHIIDIQITKIDKCENENFFTKFLKRINLG